MILELLKKRRSIRKFKNQKVEKEKIDSLVKTALLSPSSRNYNPWEFIIIDQPGLLEKLSLAKQGAGFLKNAALAIAVIADTNKSDVWIEDASISSLLLLLAAEDLGLGACWAQIRCRNHDPAVSADQYVKKILQIPDHYAVESIIGLGYAAEKKPPRQESDLCYPKIKSNQFNHPYQ